MTLLTSGGVNGRLMGRPGHASGEASRRCSDVSAAIWPASEEEEEEAERRRPSSVEEALSSKGDATRRYTLNPPPPPLPLLLASATDPRARGASRDDRGRPLAELPIT